MKSVPPLHIRDLTVAYDRVPAVHHLSGSFAPGSLTAVVGPNGAGKSTLLKAIAGLVPLGEGRIEGANGNIAYLPQLAEIDRTFPIAVIDAVSLGLWREVGLFRAITGEHVKRARAALAAVGLEGFERKQVGAGRRSPCGLRHASSPRAASGRRWCARPRRRRARREE